MKNVMCGGFVTVVLAVSAVAGAQDHKMDDNMNKMNSEMSGSCQARRPQGDRLTQDGRGVVLVGGRAVSVGLLVRLEAKLGKEDEVAQLLIE